MRYQMAIDKKHRDDTLSEEASALGQRVKGAAKDGLGALTGNERLEREGERENAEGRPRQPRNDGLDEADGRRGATGSDRVRAACASGTRGRLRADAAA